MIKIIFLMATIIISVPVGTANADWTYPIYASPQNLPLGTSTRHKKLVEQAFALMKKNFLQNHTNCQSREDCLKKDLQALSDFVLDNPNHPANPYFTNINQRIQKDALNQIFMSQWILYNKLSQQRQKEFRKGYRVSPIKMNQTVKGRDGQNYYAFYNQDDILTILVQNLDHHHHNCVGHKVCFRGDLKVIEDMKGTLNPKDPLQNVLRGISLNLHDLNRREIFDTVYYLRVYNPTGGDLRQAIGEHKQKHTAVAGHGFDEWREVLLTTPKDQWKWYYARTTNKNVAPPPPTRSTRTLYTTRPAPATKKTNPDLKSDITKDIVGNIFKKIFN